MKSNKEMNRKKKIENNFFKSLLVAFLFLQLGTSNCEASKKDSQATPPSHSGEVYQNCREGDPHECYILCKRIIPMCSFCMKNDQITHLYCSNNTKKNVEVEKRAENASNASCTLRPPRFCRRACALEKKNDDESTTGTIAPCATCKNARGTTFVCGGEAIRQYENSEKS